MCMNKTCSDLCKVNTHESGFHHSMLKQLGSFSVTWPLFASNILSIILCMIIWAKTLYIKGGNAQSMKTNHGLCMWGEIVLIFNPHPKYIFKYYESPNCPKLCNISAGIIWKVYPQCITKIANMADI